MMDWYQQPSYLRPADAPTHPGRAADVILQPGDRLTVPEYIPSVRVEGAVNGPASVLYRG